jgi:hypothetical protein
VLAAIEDRLGETGSTDPESNAYVATNVVMDLLTGLVVIDPAAVEPALRESAAFTSRVWQGELGNIIIAVREALGIEVAR